MKIEFWFDFASTYSYLSAMRIESLAESVNIEVVWRPFLLGAIFKQQGWSDSPFNIYPAKGVYMWKDMARECDDLHIPFNNPTIFPQNGLLASRIATRYSEKPWVAEFIKSIYSANFEHDKEISSLEVVSSCLKGCSDNVNLIIKEANSKKSKDMLRRQTEEAYKRGIFGAPSFFAGNELFWGNDRLEKAIKYATSNGGLTKNPGDAYSAPVI